MRALQYETYGDPDVMRVAETDEPHAGPGQVRIAVRAASVNPVDWKIRSGSSPGSTPDLLPRIPGLDAAGVVDEVGEGSADVAVGDAIFGPTIGGATAQYALLENFAAKPESMSWAEAAGLPSAVETAQRALNMLAPQPGQTLVVNGAAGGTGVAAVQLARALDVNVIGTASPANHDYLRSLGAVPTTYGDGLSGRVRELSPAGVDKALDCAGGGALTELAALTGNPHEVVSIADFSGAVPGVRTTTGAEGRSWDALALAARLYAEGRFSLPVAQTFSLEQGPQAHRVSEAGHVRGKLVIEIA
jgi:NADPH:quinone reductase-like Zn-dependent oxidoreductase